MQSIGMIFGMLLGAMIMYGATYPHLATTQGCKPVAMQWSQAPHEQQPEPMMVTASVSLGRWVL